MSAGGARRGRRDNGLDAAEYAAAGDVDPRVGEHLLDVLGAGGIAAYLQPSADLNPITRTTFIPARPTDRLFVDRAHLDTAREYLAQFATDTASERSDEAGDTARTDLPAPPDRAGRSRPAPDVDAEWARIVAAYDRDLDATVPPWPEAENVQRHSNPGPPPRPSPAPTQPPEPEGGSLLDGLDTFGTSLPDEESDEGYTPPPPPPLPRISKYAVAAVLAIVGGFVLFLSPTLLPIDPDLGMLLGFAGVLGGFVTLIWRLRASDDTDESDPDDGAVV